MSKKTSLYIHIPFCDKKCLYCSFVVVVGQNKRMSLYLDVLEREALCYKELSIENIYLGGGTPTALDIVHLQRLFAVVRENFSIAEDAEVTIEANPEGLNTEKLACLLALGVTRISLGIQTFSPRYLNYLGRIHNQEQALAAYRQIQQTGFLNINCDLMFGFPGQTQDELNQDIDQMLALKSQHVSLYSLTVDPNSRFYAQKVQVDNDEQAEQYKLIIKRLKAAGFVHYEVSNFARPGFESRHNINYWRLGEYVGLGVGAHSYYKGRRFSNTANFMEYLNRDDQTVADSTQVHSDNMSPQDKLSEALIFGLRMVEGVDIEKLQIEYSCRLDESKSEAIQRLLADGLLLKDNKRLRVSEAGLLVLDEIATRLI